MKSSLCNGRFSFVRHDAAHIASRNHIERPIAGRFEISAGRDQLPHGIAHVAAALGNGFVDGGIEIVMFKGQLSHLGIL
jgi:hypothetical protein